MPGVGQGTGGAAGWPVVSAGGSVSWPRCFFRSGTQGGCVPYGVSRTFNGYKVPHFQIVLGGEWENNASSYGLPIIAIPSQRGPDAVVEAAGNPVTWKQALAMVRRGGVVNFFSGLPSGTQVEIEPAAIHYSEIKLISPFHHTPRFFRDALEAIRRGDISAHDFVTEEIRLADLPQAFERMQARSGQIKLAVRP